MNYKEGSIPEAVLLILGSIVLVCFIALVLTWPFMLMINWLFAPSLLVTIFGVPHIGFWQTFVLATVCGWLFKSSNTPVKS